MPKYKIMGERTLVEAWTYIVEAEDEDQAIEMVEDFYQVDLPHMLPEGKIDLDNSTFKSFWKTKL